MESETEDVKATEKTEKKNKRKQKANEKSYKIFISRCLFYNFATEGVSLANKIILKIWPYCLANYSMKMDKTKNKRIKEANKKPLR